MDVNQQLTAAAKAPSKATEKSEDIFDDLLKSINRGLGGALKLVGLGGLTKIGEVSVLQQVTSQGFANKSINEAAGNFSARGGALAEAIMGGFQFDSIKDFSRVIASAIEPMQHLASDFQGTHISYGEAGLLQPMQTPNLRESQGLFLG